MSGNITRADVIEFIGKMTVAELPDFIDELKDKLKIKEMPMMAAASASPAVKGEEDAGGSESSEKTLVMVNPGPNKVSVIKAMRECISNLSLTDAKKQLDEFSQPIEIKKGLKDDLQKLKALFDTAGAQTEIK